REYFQAFAFLNNTADADRNDESPTLPFWTDALLAKKERLEKQIAAVEAAQKVAAPFLVPSYRDIVKTLQKDLAAVKPLTSVPVMKELTGKDRRKTRIQFRGNFLDLGDEVSEGTPAAFHPLPPGAPLNRLTLAKWLVSPDNPLTARVMANRFWEQIF